MDKERVSEKKKKDRLQEMEKGIFFRKKSNWGFPRGVWKIEMGRQS